MSIKYWNILQYPKAENKLTPMATQHDEAGYLLGHTEEEARCLQDQARRTEAETGSVWHR